MCVCACSDYDGFAKFCLIAGIATDKKPDAKNVPAKIKQPTTDEDAGTDVDTENEAEEPVEKVESQVVMIFQLHTHTHTHTHIHTQTYIIHAFTDHICIIRSTIFKSLN